MDLRQIPRQGEVKTSIKKTLTIKLRVVKDMLQKTDEIYMCMSHFASFL